MTNFEAGRPGLAVVLAHSWRLVLVLDSDQCGFDAEVGLHPRVRC